MEALRRCLRCGRATTKKTLCENCNYKSRLKAYKQSQKPLGQRSIYSDLDFTEYLNNVATALTEDAALEAAEADDGAEQATPTNQ